MLTKIFQPDGSDEGYMIRMEVIDGEPWFVAKDVAVALGYKRPSEAVPKHVDGDDTLKRRTVDSLGRRGTLTFINEPGVYALVFGSKLKSAKQFKRWVTHEVLPSIRKDGGYFKDQEKVGTGEISLGEATINVLEAGQNIMARQMALLAKQQAQLNAQAPKVEVYDEYHDAKGLMTAEDVAKTTRLKTAKALIAFR